MSRAMTRSRALPSGGIVPSKSGPRVLEMTKALRHDYEAVTDLTVHFRRFAKHTQVGSADDDAQAELLRTEASMLAAEVKQTVPTVTFRWLCKILYDEHLANAAEEQRNRDKIRRYYRNEPEKSRTLVEHRELRSPMRETLELSEGKDSDDE